MDQLTSEQELTFVVLDLSNGRRAWLPLLGNEAELAAFLVPGTGITEVGRTSDPEELERMMGGRDKEGEAMNDEKKQEKVCVCKDVGRWILSWYCPVHGRIDKRASKWDDPPRSGERKR